jgi:hypothetical protein
MNFLIKSTNPGVVWGDSHGSEQAIGMARPVHPEFAPPEFDAPEDPRTSAKKDASRVSRADPDFDSKVSEYEKAHAEWTQAVALHKVNYQADVEEYELANARFAARIETAREPFDRMAKIGVVPVNLYEGEPGDYIVPVEGPNDTISAIAVPAKSLTMEQHLRAVGKVTRILDDGRREVEVKAV